MHRAIAANGRVLALSMKSLNAPFVCNIGASGADSFSSFPGVTSDSLSLLGSCIGPLELAALAQVRNVMMPFSAVQLLVSRSY